MSKKRIPPSERISNEILGIIQNLDESKSNQKLLGQLIQLSMRKMMQEFLEKESEQYIGKGYYEQGERLGYRNGYKPGYLKTGEGKIPIEKPQVSDTPLPYSSHIWKHIKGNTEQLEKMAIEMYVRGCSTRDIESLLKDEEGRILLSKSGISQLNERLWEEYENFCKTDLSEYDVVYIFSDAVYESLRFHKSRKEGILVIWGILSSGEKVLLGMMLGNKESHEDWLQAYRDLKKRGLNDAVLGVTDGAPGLIGAFEEVFSKTLRQRCLVHKKRNILNKVPQDVTSEVKQYLDSVYNAPDKESAKIQADILRNKFSNRYPTAIKCFNEDFDACIEYLECPATHRKHINSTNLAERAFLEEKRRSKVIPRFFNEKSCLKLVFGTLIRASETWRKISFTFEDQVKIMELKQKLGHKVIKEKIISKDSKEPVYKRNFSRKNKT